ncbi:MAG: hypothetical protein P4L90_15165 [Rhodopila sp.]|nr:hypothetical protein [Rhodopila sp.]
MSIRNELIDELLAGQDPASVMRQDGWQSRPLEPLYPVPHSVGVCQAYPNAKVMFFDAIRVKVRDRGTVCNKAV